MFSFLFEVFFNIYYLVKSYTTKAYGERGGVLFFVGRLKFYNQFLKLSTVLTVYVCTILIKLKTKQNLLSQERFLIVCLPLTVNRHIQIKVNWLVLKCYSSRLVKYICQVYVYKIDFPTVFFFQKINNKEK